jgi:hypothetical protein
MLSGLLPLRISGRHYGDNLARVDLLFSSLEHFATPGLLDELIVVARDDEAELIEAHLSQWPELPLRIVVEDDHFPLFRRFTRPWQIRPWQRQQIIKLNAPAFTTTPFVLTLDPDVLAVKQVSRRLLLPGGRAILEPEARSVHARWWRDAADLLAVDPEPERPGMAVTPGLLSTAILREVQRRLEEVGGRPWMEILLTSYCDWTEYTLYLLAAERAALLGRHHVWADGPGAPAHLQVDPALSIWEAATASRANIERLFVSDDPGLFAAVQSNAGLAAEEVAVVAARHFPVRRTSAPPPLHLAGRSKLQERTHTVSRLAAQRFYRLRGGAAGAARRRKARHRAHAASARSGSQDAPLEPHVP